MKTLTLIDRAFFLKRIPIFSRLDLDLLLAIADKLQIGTIDPGETIFRFEEEAFHMYFIVKGQVALRQPDHPPVILGPEEFFGDESIFNERVRAYEAVSQAETTLLGLTRTNLLTIISECPSVAVGFLQTYTSAMPFRPRNTRFLKKTD